MTSSNDDFFLDAADEDASSNIASSSGAMSEAARLGKFAIELTENISVIEAQLAAEKKALNKILISDLPAVLKEAGTDQWRDPDTGIVIELKMNVDAKMPKDQDKRVEFFESLKPTGVFEILKQEFTVLFAPGDQRISAVRAILFPNEPNDLEPEVLQRVAELCDSLGLNNMPGEQKLGVNASTFKSWLKKIIESNEQCYADGSDDLLDLDEDAPVMRPATDIIRDAGIWFGEQAFIKIPRKKSGG